MSKLKRLKRIARQYHRHPAGSAKGGQFAPRSGGYDLTKDLSKGRIESFGRATTEYGLSQNEASALYLYSTAEYASINQAVRSGDLDARGKAIFEGVSGALNKLPKTTGTVYRGTGVNFNPQEVFVEGAVVRLPGFTSTTDDWRRAQWFAENSDGSYPLYMEIHAKGKHGANISEAPAITQRSTERETLFPHNVRFRVLTAPELVEDGDKFWYYVELEEV